MPDWGCELSARSRAFVHLVQDDTCSSDDKCSSIVTCLARHRLSSGQAISLFGNSLKQPTILHRVQLTGLGDADATQNPVKRTTPEPVIIVDAQPLSHDRARFAMTRHTNQFWHESSIARLLRHNATLTTRFDMAARRPLPRCLTAYLESARRDFVRCKRRRRSPRRIYEAGGERRQRSRDDASVKQAIQRRPSNSNRDPVM